ncbi:hypothetical protein OU997_03160 [Pseudomonas sp. SL4(2022)]|uniref:beta family protein n=1 Tax=Pseudomonas sp. SL4(2022) TaxID=2994661 RepID=UPI00226FF2BC|nr:hypothetical protein [Pseudomonas sp. SL4(2022)]WAC45207.1 hypothetical protein OU997_03160 [Pseudomonas sp. SL4(2022)]
MYNYAPFLKFKQNEIQAVFSIYPDVQNFTLPLFDIPKEKKQDTESDILSRLRKGEKQLAAHSNKIPNLHFFIDNYDLDDSVLLCGAQQYRYILNELKAYNIIPVVAFDRAPDHNVAAIEYCKNNSGSLGIRLQTEDFQSFNLLKPKLAKILAEAAGVGVTKTYLVFDCRLIEKQGDVDDLHASIEKFYKQCSQQFMISHYIVVGSVIPANIAKLMKTKTTMMVERLEDKLWRKLAAIPETSTINYGDYGVVSPEFSESDLPVNLMPKYMAPKVFYTTAGEFYAERGGQFQGHAKGYGQYFDIADNIVSKPYFRDGGYSDGDKYIHARSNLSARRPQKGGAPGSWIKATLSSHITFVVRKR